MRREFTFLGRFVVIEEPDEWDSPHHLGEAGTGHDDHDGGDHDGGGHDGGGHGEHEIKLEIDGRRIMVHRMSAGDFHAHDMPFVRFSNVDDLARTYVTYLEYGIDYGRSEESE